MLAAALVLASDPPPDTSCVTATQPPLRSLRDCITVTSQRLERSGESPTDVAIATLAVCSTERETLRRAVATCLPPDMTDDTMKGLDQMARDSAVADVVSIRAARHAPPK